MKRAIRCLLALIVTITAILSGVPAYAAEGQFSLHIYYHAESVETVINGASFSIVRVAAGDKSSGSYIYTLEEPYKDSGVNPNDLGEDLKGTAETLLQYYKAGATVVTTGSDGRASASFDTPGLYLVWQTGSSGTAERYYEAAPMLVFLPAPAEKGTAWNSNVTIEPKTGRRPDTPGDGGGKHDGGHGAVSIYKVDADNQNLYLEGAVFTLYKSNGDKVGTYTTNVNGYVGIYSLPYGSYYLIEDQAPEGYIGTSDKITFTLNESTSWSVDYPWNIKVTNTKIPSIEQDIDSQTPSDQTNTSAGGPGTTGDDSHMMLWGVLTLLSAAALVIVIKRENDHRAGR